MTITIQIGNTDDKLSQGNWALYVESCQTAIEAFARQTHFFGGSSNWCPWQNACWVIDVDAKQAQELMDALTNVRKTWKQDTLAWTWGSTIFL